MAKSLFHQTQVGLPSREAVAEQAVTFKAHLEEFALTATQLVDGSTLGIDQHRDWAMGVREERAEAGAAKQPLP